MASSLSSANSCTTNMRIHFFNNNLYKKQRKQNLNFFRIRASSVEEEDCNVEECAPDKEVGKVSMEWLAGEKTKVGGTFPPRRREWSGYVEKDTAGQTNIYSVEPAIYVAESAISSGTSGTSADGAENTAALVAFSGLIAVAAASVVLFQVGKTPPQINTLDYSGPSLSYYITKFKPSEIVQVSETSQQPQTQLDSETKTSELDSETQTSEQPQTQLDSETQIPTSAEISTLQILSETDISTPAQQPESGTTPQEAEVQLVGSE